MRRDWRVLCVTPTCEYRVCRVGRFSNERDCLIGNKRVFIRRQNHSRASTLILFHSRRHIGFVDRLKVCAVASLVNAVRARFAPDNFSEKWLVGVIKTKIKTYMIAMNATKRKKWVFFFFKYINKTLFIYCMSPPPNQTHCHCTLLRFCCVFHTLHLKMRDEDVNRFVFTIFYI